MNKEINYPIKYAVLELKERGGYLAQYEDITKGFIVSKCYVVQSSIEYYKDGTNRTTHKVVFPFNDISEFKFSLKYKKQRIGEENIPHYDASNNPYPINIVTELFDTYEEAKSLATLKNEEYKCNIISKVPAPITSKTSNLSWLERIKILEQEFEQTLELCNLYEQKVLEATKDMLISEPLIKNKNKSNVKALKPIK